MLPFSSLVSRFFSSLFCSALSSDGEPYAFSKPQAHENGTEIFQCFLKNKKRELHLDNMVSDTAATQAPSQVAAPPPAVAKAVRIAIGAIEVQVSPGGSGASGVPLFTVVHRGGNGGGGELPPLPPQSSSPTNAAAAAANDPNSSSAPSSYFLLYMVVGFSVTLGLIMLFTSAVFAVRALRSQAAQQRRAEERREQRRGGGGGDDVEQAAALATTPPRTPKPAFLVLNPGGAAAHVAVAVSSSEFGSVHSSPASKGKRRWAWRAGSASSSRSGGGRGEGGGGNASEQKTPRKQQPLTTPRRQRPRSGLISALMMRPLSAAATLGGGGGGGGAGGASSSRAGGEEAEEEERAAAAAAAATAGSEPNDLGSSSEDEGDPEAPSALNTPLRRPHRPPSC